MANAIGIFGDTVGDLGLFESALRFLSDRGAKRFLFAGGNYDDLDDWLQTKRDEMRAQADYSNGDFLEDVSRFLLGLEQKDRPAAFGTAWELAREHFLVITTCEWDAGNAARWFAEKSYPELVRIFGVEPARRSDAQQHVTGAREILEPRHGVGVRGAEVEPAAANDAVHQHVVFVQLRRLLSVGKKQLGNRALRSWYDDQVLDCLSMCRLNMASWHFTTKALTHELPPFDDGPLLTSWSTRNSGTRPITWSLFARASLKSNRVC